MDRDLPALPSIAFVASLLLALYVYMHNILSISHSPVSQIVPDASGRVWALYADALVRLPIGKDAATEQTLSLEPLGIQHVVGKVIPLPNDGWLVNTGGQQQSVVDNFKRLLRLSAADNHTDKGSLLACDATLKDCQPWGDTTLSFDQPWGGLALDNGQFLIHDSARHKVYLVAADGKVLSTLGGFEFPNQIQYAQGKYWVLDTNHNQLVAIQPDANQLIRTGETVYFGDLKGIDGQHLFPSLFLPDGTDWWLLSNDVDMAHPGLYRIGTEATRYGRDIGGGTALYHDGQALYVADFDNQSIQRIDPHSGQSTTLAAAGLAQQSQVLDAKTTESRYWVWLTIGAILVAGLGLLAFAIWKSTPADIKNRPVFWLSSRHIKIDDPDYAPSSNTHKVVWLKPNEADIHKLTKKRLLINLGLGTLILLSGVIAFVIYTNTNILNHALYFMVGLTAPLLITLIIINRFITRITHQFSEKKIGLIDDKIIIAQKNQPIEEVDASNTLYTDGSLCLNGHNFTMQTPQWVFMDKESFERHAAPLVNKGKRVPPLVLYWQTLKNGRDPVMRIELLLMVLAVLCVVVALIVLRLT